MRFDVCTLIPQFRAAPWVGHYSFRADRPLRLVQGLCLWILGRLGCESEVSETHHVKIKPRDLSELACHYLQRYHQVYGYGSPRPKYLLIGSEQLEGLKDISDRIISFYAPADSVIGVLYGLQIVVIPWMEGALILPALEDIPKVW